MITELKISGMTCGHCVAHVAEALQAVTGVETAQVDLEAGTARVEAEGVSAQQLIAAVEEEGYGASAQG